MSYNPINSFDFTNARQADKIIRTHNKEIERKRQQEEENPDNLNSIAKDSQEMVQTLKEMNEVLKQNNKLLQEKNESLEIKLSNIQDVLYEILDVDIQNGEDQKKLMQEATALACEIVTALERGEKVNLKDKVADVGVQTFIFAVSTVLKMKGLLP